MAIGCVVTCKNDESSCSVAHHPSINAAVDLLKQGETSYQRGINALLPFPFGWCERCLFVNFSILLPAMADLNIEPYDEDNGTGELRYVQVKCHRNMYSVLPVSTLLVKVVRAMTWTTTPNT